VYLSMQKYKEAGLYADSCLQIYNTLIDYNTIDTSSDAPFTQFNAEDIYDTQAAYPSALYQGNAKVDSVLYKSYSDNDIRKAAFFSTNGDGTYYFKGNYTGKANDPTMFTGIATDEMFLTRAECLARQGDSSNALKDLNFLLSDRIKGGTFIPYSLPVEGGLLKLILHERRKELPFRELRWTDLRRLNKEQEFKDTLYRYINGKEYILLPESMRYTLQIDKRSIQISGIEQNP
jgi:starch-binding outer membrane protein, SusD/RagB family